MQVLVCRLSLGLRFSVSEGFIAFVVKWNQTPTPWFPFAYTFKVSIAKAMMKSECLLQRPDRSIVFVHLFTYS